jgi:hypothetical protein
MKRIRAWIEGITPLLQHRFHAEPACAPATDPHAVAHDQAAARARAERAAYRTSEGHLYLPGAAIAALLREAAHDHRLPGSCGSLARAIPTGIVVLDDHVRLFTKDRRTPLTDFGVDARAVRDPETGERQMRYRARVDAWWASALLGIHEEVISTQLAHQLLAEGGRRIGVGSFRPSQGGSFGLFEVRVWEDG